MAFWKSAVTGDRNVAQAALARLDMAERAAEVSHTNWPFFFRTKRMMGSLRCCPARSPPPRMHGAIALSPLELGKPEEYYGYPSWTLRAFVPFHRTTSTR